MSHFLMDIEKIRSEAMHSLDDGAVTPANRTDQQAVLDLLDAALATEWICVLRYSQHAVTATGLHAEAVAAEFAEHAAEELGHAKKLAERIDLLGGTPSLEPSHLAEAAHSRYKECGNLVEMIKENLTAERIAIISYAQMIRYIGDKDSTTRRLFEEILAKEEEHADDLASFLDVMDAREAFH